MVFSDSEQEFSLWQTQPDSTACSDYRSGERERKEERRKRQRRCEEFPAPCHDDYPAQPARV